MSLFHATSRGVIPFTPEEEAEAATRAAAHAAKVAAAAVRREAAGLLAAGVQIVSAGNLALDGIYPMDAEAERRIGGILNGLANGLGLPKGGATVPYADVNGVPRDFTAAEIKALAAAMRDYAFDIEQALGAKLAGQSADWPSLPIAIG